MTGLSFFLLLPDSFLVVSYSSFMFFFAAAFSACLARFSTKFHLSLLMLLFTSLLAVVYRFCASAFSALVQLLFRSSFLAFRICSFFSVSTVIRSLCCIVFLPTVCLHVSIQAFLVLCHLFSRDWSSSSSKSCSAWNLFERLIRNCSTMVGPEVV